MATLLRFSLRAVDSGSRVWSRSGQLAVEYGFTDVDGFRPEVWRYMADEERGLDVDPADYR